MPPNQRIDGPARWKLIEATNGYDIDNSMNRNQAPFVPGPPPHTRAVRSGHILGRFRSALSVAQRRRQKRRIGPAGAAGSDV